MKSRTLFSAIIFPFYTSSSNIPNNDPLIKEGRFRLSKQLNAIYGESGEIGVFERKVDLNAQSSQAPIAVKYSQRKRAGKGAAKSPLLVVQNVTTQYDIGLMAQK